MVWFIPVLSLVLTMLLFTSMVAEESVVRVPSIEGKALTGDKFAAPGDFTRPFNILLIAFLREQQEDIDTWLLRLEELEDSDQDIAVYEFPVLPEMNRVTRWFIYQGMRGGIPSERARARTVTFHLDKEEFRNALKIGTEDSIQVFLADSSGTVIWRETGVWSEAKQSEMMSVIRPQEKPGAP